MGIPVLILGESGTGKTTSLRNLDADRTALIQAVSKPLPFKSNFKPRDSKAQTGTVNVCDNSDQIIKLMRGASQAGFKVIIIDDFQYVMANEFMRRSAETGFNKFTEIAKHAWDIAMAAQALPVDVRVYLLSHTQTDDQGNTKIKTIGKLLDEKITLEGLFTIVMRTLRIDGKYLFSTQNNGHDTVKTPMDMFPEDTIENDLQMVDNAITAYYEI